MMCIACEQEALWFAYLQKRGLITADGLPVEQPQFDAAPVGPSSVRTEENEETMPRSVDEGELSCDDPAATAANLSFPQSGRKSE